MVEFWEKPPLCKVSGGILPPAGRAWESPGCYGLASTGCGQRSGWRPLMGAKWCLVVSVCGALRTQDVEDLLLCLFFIEAFRSFGPSFNRVACSLLVGLEGFVVRFG